MTPEALSALHARCFTVPRPFTTAEFVTLLAAPGCFLCTVKDGFALGRTVADEADLLTLAVAPEERRKGRARQLLAKFEAQAIQQGAGTAFLDVAADNGAARALYRSAGWRETGRRRGYYRRPDGVSVDAVVMRKTLTPG